jgi:hypothetical protein
MQEPLKFGVALLLVACSDSFRAAPADGAAGHVGERSDAGDPGAGGASLGAGGMHGGGLATGTGAAGGSRADAAFPDDAGGAPRRFRLATSGAQLVVSGPMLGLQLTAADLATDADVIAVHQEFYGVPWDAFTNGTPPPAEWTALMKSLAAGARSAMKPVFLSLTMLNGTRDRLAATTSIENGQVKTKDATSDACYDFRAAPDGTSRRTAYLRYVEWMMDTFAPAYLNVAVEVNLFLEKCASAAPALVEVANAAYDAAKAKSPGTIVFPSIQIDHLYGYSKDSCPDQTARGACFEKAYAAVTNLKRDRFAMSSYPYLSGVADPASLPADWFTRAAARGKERPLIAETGWLSTGLTAKARDGSCQPVFDFATADAAAYLGRVLADADSSGMDLATWWSDRDLLPERLMTNCPCTFDATWCGVVDVFRGAAPPGTADTGLIGEVLMKAFGTMGLRRYDGAPKPPLYGPWSAALQRPLVP